MILVTGATGHLGGHALQHLVKHLSSKSVVALARNREKAKPLIDAGIQVRFGDFDDPASLDKAFQGIEKVLLVSTLELDRLRQHSNVVDAARKAGVRQIAYTGISHGNLEKSALKPLIESHFQTEEYIRNSGIPFTFLRHTLYIDVIPNFVGEAVFEKGIYLPAGSGKVPYALRREMGEAAANVLMQEGHSNKTYEITGSALYSYKDVADTLTSLSGKKVGFTDADPAAFAQLLKDLQLPESLQWVSTGFMADIKAGYLGKIYPDLANLLGRQPADLATGLKEVYHL